METKCNAQHHWVFWWWLLIGLLLSSCGSDEEIAVATQIYYFDSIAGDDGNDGRTVDTPFRTLSVIESLDFSTPTLLNLKRTSVWHESINLPASGISIDSYGSGDLPIIDGASLVTGWSHHSADIYTVTLPLMMGEALGNLSQDGVMLNFTPWDNDIATTFSSAVTGSYSFQYPSTLYLKSAEPPSSYTYYASRLLRGVYSDSLSDISIKNIKIQRSSLHGIELKDCQRCRIQGVTVVGVGGAVIGANPLPTSDDYLYAGNGIDIAQSSSSVRVMDVVVDEIFDSCLALELYQPDQYASDIQFLESEVSRCGFAGVEISVLKNVDTINSHIDGVVVSGIHSDQSGAGWSQRRYGSEGHGIRIVADEGAGTMQNIQLTQSQFSASAGDGVHLAGEIGLTKLHQLHIHNNSAAGLKVASSFANTLSASVSSSLIESNGGYGVSYNAPNALGLMLFHNTFYQNSLINLALFSDVAVADFRNNLFYSENPMTHLFSSLVLSGATINNNCYNDTVNMFGYAGATYSNLLAFNGDTGFESNGLGSGVVGLNAPSAGDFSLQSGSDCRGLGDSMAGIAEDYFGFPYAIPPDSGAVSF